MSFCLTLVKFNHHRKDGKWFGDKEPIDSATKTEATDVSHLSGGDLYKAFRPLFRWSQIRKKSKLQTEKTMVGFGRTELSLSLSCTEFRALSHGHGFRGPCFNGVRKSWVFHDFWPVFFFPFLDGFSMVILEKLSKIGFDHPKRCGRFGGPWETGFRAEIPEI